MQTNFSDISKLFSWEVLSTHLVTLSLRTLFALLIMFGGYFIIKITLGVIRKTTFKVITDTTFAHYIYNCIRIILWSVLILSVIGFFGIPTVSFASILGAITLAIGLGVQGSLTNFTAGLMMLLLRPFKTDDNIEVANIKGKVVEIGMFSTEIATKENSRAYVPNNLIFSGIIINRSKTSFLKLELMITVAENTDINKLQQLCLRVLAAQENVLESPKAEVILTEANRNGITVLLKPCVATELADQTKAILLMKLREEFYRENITIVTQ